jgi:hypothetical protein
MNDPMLPLCRACHLLPARRLLSTSTNGLDYILGVAPTATLRRHIGDLEASVKARYEAAPKDGKARRYKADSGGGGFGGASSCAGDAILVWGFMRARRKR